MRKLDERQRLEPGMTPQQIDTYLKNTRRHAASREPATRARAAKAQAAETNPEIFRPQDVVDKKMRADRVARWEKYDEAKREYDKDMKKPRVPSVYLPQAYETYPQSPYRPRHTRLTMTGPFEGNSPKSSFRPRFMSKPDEQEPKLDEKVQIPASAAKVPKILTADNARQAFLQTPVGSLPYLTFPRLGVAPQLWPRVHEAGYHQPTAVQLAALPHLLPRRAYNPDFKPPPSYREAAPWLPRHYDVLLQDMTGSGKTLAYLLPALQSVNVRLRDLQSVILCPTRELCVQTQVQAVRLAKAAVTKAGEIIVRRVNGNLRQVSLDDLRRNPPHVLVTTPRTFKQLLEAHMKEASSTPYVKKQEAGAVDDDGLHPSKEKSKGVAADRAAKSDKDSSRAFTDDQDDYVVLKGEDAEAYAEATTKTERDAIIRRVRQASALRRMRIEEIRAAKTKKINARGGVVLPVDSELTPEDVRGFELDPNVADGSGKSGDVALGDVDPETGLDSQGRPVTMVKVEKEQQRPASAAAEKDLASKKEQDEEDDAKDSEEEWDDLENAQLDNHKMRRVKAKGAESGVQTSSADVADVEDIDDPEDWEDDDDADAQYGSDSSGSEDLAGMSSSSSSSSSSSRMKGGEDPRWWRGSFHPTLFEEEFEQAGARIVAGRLGKRSDTPGPRKAFTLDQLRMLVVDEADLATQPPAVLDLVHILAQTRIVREHQLSRALTTLPAPAAHFPFERFPLRTVFVTATVTQPLVRLAASFLLDPHLITAGGMKSDINAMQHNYSTCAEPLLRIETASTLPSGDSVADASSFSTTSTSSSAPASTTTTSAATTTSINKKPKNRIPVDRSVSRFESLIRPRNPIELAQAVERAERRALILQRERLLPSSIRHLRLGFSVPEAVFMSQFRSSPRALPQTAFGTDLRTHAERSGYMFDERVKQLGGSRLAASGIANVKMEKKKTAKNDGAAASADAADAADGASEEDKLLTRWTQLQANLLARIDAAVTPRTMLVFANNTVHFDELALALRSKGFRVGSLVRDTDKTERAKTLKRMAAGSLDIVLASNMVARGVDVTGVDLVVNLGVPGDAYWYVHRAGRVDRMKGRHGSMVITLTAHVHKSKQQQQDKQQQPQQQQQRDASSASNVPAETTPSSTTTSASASSSPSSALTGLTGVDKVEALSPQDAASAYKEHLTKVAAEAPPLLPRDRRLLSRVSWLVGAEIRQVALDKGKLVDLETGEALVCKRRKAPQTEEEERKKDKEDEDMIPTTAVDRDHATATATATQGEDEDEGRAEDYVDPMDPDDLLEYEGVDVNKGRVHIVTDSEIAGWQVDQPMWGVRDAIGKVTVTRTPYRERARDRHNLKHAEYVREIKHLAYVARKKKEAEIAAKTASRRRRQQDLKNSKIEVPTNATTFSTASSSYRLDLKKDRSAQPPETAEDNEDDVQVPEDHEDTLHRLRMERRKSILRRRGGPSRL